MKTRHSFLATAAIAALMASGAALAHPGGGYGPGMGMGPGMGQHGMGPGMGPGMMGGRGAGPDPAAMTRRLDETKAALKISAEQEAAWKTYADVQTRQVEARANFREQMGRQWAERSATLPDRESLHETMLKFRQEMQAQRTAALKGLYGVLSTEQKAQADRLLAGWGAGQRMAGGYGPGGGRGHGHHQGGWR